MSKMSKAALESRCELLEEMNKRLLEENQKLKKQLSSIQIIGIRKSFNNEEVIKEMYNLYINGLSLKQIAEILNKKNIKTALGKNWGKSSISLILKKEKNKNIVGNELYEKVLMKMNSKKPTIEKR